MTTPKKPKYQLRNRTVLVPASAGGSGPGGPPGPDNIAINLEASLDESEDLMSESMPQEMQEEQTEALMTEIRKLQVPKCRVKTELVNIWETTFGRCASFSLCKRGTYMFVCVKRL